MPLKRRMSPASGQCLYLLMLSIAIAAPLLHLSFINRDMPSSKSDLRPLLVGSRDMLQGGADLYSSSVLRDMQIAYYGRPLTLVDHVDPHGFLYPAHLGLLLGPITSLPWNTVRLSFLIILPPLIAASVYLWMLVVGFKAGHITIAAAIILSLCSWPMMWGLRQQRPTLFVAVLAAAACFFLSRGHGILAGVMLALTTVKPQLVIPLIAWLLLWSLMQRLWSFISAFTTTLAVLLVWTEQLVPGWFSHWVAALSRVRELYLLQPPLQITFGHWPGLLALMALGAWGSLILWRLRRSHAGSPEFGVAVALALGIAVCATPTNLAIIYNQVLLLPAFLILLQTTPAHEYAASARRLALLALVWGFLAVPIAVLGESVLGPSALWQCLPFMNMLLPVFAVLALGLTWWFRNSANPTYECA